VAGEAEVKKAESGSGETAALWLPVSDGKHNPPDFAVRKQ